MINKFNAKLLTISGVAYLILGVIIVNAITGTYAYTDTCPDGYTDQGNGTCSRLPEYGCPAGGSYDYNVGRCTVEESCPAGYNLTDDNFCNMQFDACIHEGASVSGNTCTITKSCPVGYTLTDDNLCVSSSAACPSGDVYDGGNCLRTIKCPSGYHYVDTIGNNNYCVTPDYSPDTPLEESADASYVFETPTGYTFKSYTVDSVTFSKTAGGDAVTLSTPSGYSISGKNGNTMIYTTPMNSCPSGGAYDGNGYCNKWLSTPSGYSIHSTSGSTMIYGAAPTGGPTCPNGGTYDSNDGYCYYQLSNKEEPENPGTGGDNTGGDNTGGDNTGGDNTGGGNNTETKKYQVTFESLDEEYLINPELLYNDGVVENYVVNNGTSSSFQLSDYWAISDNYDFIYWSSGDCSDLSSMLLGNITLTEENTTIYACWKEKDDIGGDDIYKYDVTFDVGDGALYVDNNKTTSLTYKLIEIDFSKYVAKKDKHTFVGWSTSENNCTTAVTSGVRDLTNDTKLYACYKAVVEEKIENPKTGKGALYLAFVLGGVALAAVLYCSRKFIKE